MTDESQFGITRSKGGRKPGTPNRTTKQSRQAIGLFIEQNVPRLDGWLQQVANGLPKVDANGELIRDSQGSVVWVNKPDPAGALKAVADIAEFHLPKLSRSDVTMVASIENEHLRPLEDMTSAELKQLILRESGIDADNVDSFIEARAARVINPEPVPEWLQPDGPKD